jgi:hypothetical protein
MPLETQVIDIPLEGGLAQAQDPRLVPLGSWLKLKNIRRARMNGFQGRYGTTALSRNILSQDQSQLTSLLNLGSYDGDLIAIDNNNHLYTYAQNQWIDRSVNRLPTIIATQDRSPQPLVWPTQVYEQTVFSLTDQIITCDNVRTSDGLIHFAMEVIRKTDGNHYLVDVVIDESTGSVVRGPIYVTSPAYGPRVFLIDGKVTCVYSDGINKLMVTQKSNSIANYATAVQLVIGQQVAVSPHVFDAKAFDFINTTPPLHYKFVVAYEGNTGIVLQGFDANFNSISNHSSNFISSNFKSVAIGVAPNESRVWVAATAVNNIIKVSRWEAKSTTFGELVEQAPPTDLVITPAGGPMLRLACIRYDSTSCFVIGSSGDDQPASPVLFYNGVDINGNNILSIFSITSWGYKLVSEPFFGPDNRLYFWARDETYLTKSPSKTYLNGSLFLVDSQWGEQKANILLDPTIPRFYGRVVARAAQRQLQVTPDDFTSKRRVASAIATTNTSAIPVPKVVQLQLNLSPIEFVSATWGDPSRARMVQFGKSLYISPGQVFGGDIPEELGFHRAPDQPDLSDGGAGGNLSAGQYQVCTVLRKINAAGEVVRSMPSAAASFTLAAGHKLVIGTGNFGGFTDSKYRVVIEIYRTKANGSTFYLSAELAVQFDVPGSPGIGFTYTDNLSDSALASRPILYTGARLPNLTPPNLTSLTVWGNRLIGIGPDKHTIWISSETFENEQPYFNETYNVTVPNSELTTLAVMDDKLLAFAKDTAYIIEGSPPDALGNGNTLVAHPFSMDLGCIDERGILTSGNGVLFRDRRAASLVARNLSLQSLGLNVQDEFAANPVVKSAVHVDRDREARFAVTATENSTTGQVLVYETNTNQWFTRTYYDPTSGTEGAAIVAMTVADGIWYAGFANGQVIKEDPSVFTDSGKFVGWEIVSPKMHFGAIGGFQRCRRAMVLMERASPHDVQIDVMVDGPDDVVQTEQWTSGQLAQQSTFPIEKCQVHMQYQKESSVQLRVKCLPPSDESQGTGEGARLFGMTLSVGVKKGQDKLSDEQKG